MITAVFRFLNFETFVAKLAALDCLPPQVKQWPDNEYYLPGRA